MRKATLAIITRGNEVLLGHKLGKPLIGAGTLNGPGGHVEAGESPLACAVRETQEEVGITLDIATTTRIAIIDFYAGGVLDFRVFVYHATEWSGEPMTTDSMAPEWHAIEKIPWDRMLESDKEWFPLLLCGERFRARVYYRERAKGFIGIEFDRSFQG